MLSAELASALARVALANTEREFPHAIAHRMVTPQDELYPRKVHPAFFGSYDWHSAVHMHWSLVRVLRLYPMLPENGRIAALLDAHLSPGALEAELRYVKANPLFERPYGWAWLLELQAEALRTKARWSRALEPLARELAQRMGDFVGNPYPIRAGSHGNTAFACVLALDYARAAGDVALEFAVVKAAKRWYGSDRDAPLAYEPSLDDFLSPSLVEALLMQQVLAPEEFSSWLSRFLPSGIGPLAEPPVVADRSDAKQSHLDGLCLSRAWCFNALGLSGPAEKHLAAGLPQVVGGDYVGEHWLASFAVLALSAAALRTP
ncbi:MAG TPA: DUF2891 domain-containing protein [Burkholderiales bacterium]|nr:DUF2891 domain-containing protein [Burkholderiales bacterium]